MNEWTALMLACSKPRHILDSATSVESLVRCDRKKRLHGVCSRAILDPDANQVPIPYTNTLLQAEYESAPDCFVESVGPFTQPVNHLLRFVEPQWSCLSMSVNHIARAC